MQIIYGKVGGDLQDMSTIVVIPVLFFVAKSWQMIRFPLYEKNWFDTFVDFNKKRKANCDFSWPFLFIIKKLSEIADRTTYYSFSLVALANRSTSPRIPIAGSHESIKRIAF